MKSIFSNPCCPKKIPKRVLRTVGRPFVFGCMVISCFVHAKSVETPIALHQAVVNALELHPSLLSQEYLIKAAEANIAQAKVGTRKTASIELEDFFGTDNFEEWDRAQSTFSVSWVIESSLLQARQGFERNKKSIAVFERNILQFGYLLRYGAQVFSVLRYQEELALAKQWLQSVETMHTSIKEYVKAGRLRDADQYLSLASVAQSRLDVEDLHHEIKAARVNLAAMWGSTQPQFPSVFGNLRHLSPVPSYEHLLVKIDSSPALKMAELQQELVQAEVNVVKQGAKPRPTFTAGVRHFSEQDDLGLVAGVSLPLGGIKRNRSKIQALESNKQSLMSSMQASRIENVTVLYELYQAYKHATHGVDVIEQEIIPALQKALENTQRAYTLGRASYQDWLSIRKELFQYRIQLVETYYSAHIKRIEIERLIGQPISNPEDSSIDFHEESEGNH